MPDLAAAGNSAITVRINDFERREHGDSLRIVFSAAQ
jgi:hypothetical protein